MTSISRVFLRIWWCALTGLGTGTIVTSCGSPAPSDGTNTNWLTCTTDADCDLVNVPATCTAGFCSAPDGGAKIVRRTGSAWPSCRMPESDDAGIQARTECALARAYLNCDAPGGGGEICISDDPTGCTGGLAASLEPCTNACHVNEYAAACGGVGPGPVPDPPTGCRYAGSVPAGVGFYCCPCL